MKKNILLSGIILAFCLTTACSTMEETAAPESLYKTKAGKEIAYQSYDRVLELWEVDYREEYVETSYGQSHVVVVGEAEQPPLVLLPGLFADATMWYPNVAALSKYYQVYVLDMMNYGGKSIPAGKAIQGIENYAGWFHQLLDHYGLDRVAVGGLSYSSWLALALAREHPERFAGLLMLDPSETFMPMDGGIAWKGFKAFVFFPSREKYREFFLWMGGGYSNPQMDIWAEHLLDVIEFGSVKMTDVPRHKIYTPEELEMIQMPVLIMAGGKPILYKDPQEFKANALRAIPHAEVVIVPGAGHGLNAEKPEAVNREMIEFLKRHVYGD